jgi:hypothetical protein
VVRNVRLPGAAVAGFAVAIRDVRAARAWGPVALTRASGRWTQERLFGLLDADGNGRLTRNEIVHDRALARDMGRVDRNQDGALSYDEFSSYRR